MVMRIVSPSCLAPFFEPVSALPGYKAKEDFIPPPLSEWVRPVSRSFAAVLTAGMLLGCAGVEANPLVIAELASGVGLLAGAGFMARSVLIGLPKRLAQIQRQQREAEDFETKLKAPAEHAEFEQENPDVMIALLQKMQDESVQAVADVGKKILAFQDTIKVCDAFLSRMDKLRIKSDAPERTKIIEIKAKAMTKIEEYVGEGGTLERIKSRAAKIPDWITAEEQRYGKLEAERAAKRTAEEERALLRKDLEAFGVQTAELEAESEAVEGRVETLAEEIESMGVDLGHAEGLEEIETWLALPDNSLSDAQQDRFLRELEKERALRAQRIVVGGAR